MPGTPKAVADLLKDTRYGVSFPCTTGCQMRFVHKGEDLGGFYAYSQWGGVRPAVKAAIARNQQLRAKYGRNDQGRLRVREKLITHGNTGVVGVSGSWNYDRRRDSWSWRYQVSWRIDGVPKTKSFHLMASATPDQFLHAFRTAIQFRREWELTGNQFDPSRYQLWRTRRLYEPGTPLLPDDFFQSPRDSQAA